MNKSRQILIAVTGASGAVYAKRLLDKLKSIMQPQDKTALIFSKNAIDVWKYELSDESYGDYPFEYFQPDDFFSGPASGSAGYDTMIICPASMGTVGRIAGGISNDLITRAADVILKEHRKLIVVPRETPFNLIHLRNLTTLAEAGAVIIPASPSFYSKPQTLEEAADTVVEKILKLAELKDYGFKWGEK